MTTNNRSPNNPPATRLTQPRIVLLLASLCCLLWGSAYPAIKQGYALLSIGRDDLAAQMLFAGYRFVGAGVLLMVFAWFTGRALTRLAPRQLAQTGLLGLLQTTLQYIFFYIGLAHTTGVNGAILNASGVFFSVLLAHWVYHNDTLNWRKVLGCAIGFSGVLVVNIGPLLGSAPTDGGVSIMGEGFIVLAAFVLSAASIYGKRVSQSMDAVVMTAYQLAFGGLGLMAIGWVAGAEMPAFSLAAGLLLVYMMALSAVAFAVWGALLKHNRVSKVAIFSFLIPVFGASLSALFLGESLLEWKYLLALVLVCLGIWRVSQEN
ncbi:MAG: DMT family transporter [Rhodoferax sp.]|nr:DMT family transporter [Rhodoferax sp.]